MVARQAWQLWQSDEAAGCWNFHETPGCVWHVAQAGSCADAGLKWLLGRAWQLAQSPCVGCEKTHFGPAWWHFSQAPLGAWLGVWHS